MTTLSLGAVGSQPLRVQVVGKNFSREQKFVVLAQPRSELKHNKVSLGDVEAGRKLLEQKIEMYVPSKETAESWIEAFEKFRSDWRLKQSEQGVNRGENLAAEFTDFVAALYSRTQLKDSHGHKLPGFLEVASVYTYLRYVSQKYPSVRFMPAFKAVETESSSIGCKNKAPKIDPSCLKKVLMWISQGPAAELKKRAGAWLQCAAGGRVCDVARLRGPGLQLTPERYPKIVDWRWTKSIKRSADAKTVHPPECVWKKVGPAPFTVKDWTTWSERHEFPLHDYSINDELAELSKDFSEKLTSTSLRDVYHEIIDDFCDHDPKKMQAYTVHKSAKSIAASYMSGRRVATAKSNNASQKTRAARKAKTTVKKTKKPSKTSSKKR